MGIYHKSHAADIRKIGALIENLSKEGEFIQEVCTFERYTVAAYLIDQSFKSAFIFSDHGSLETAVLGNSYVNFEPEKVSNLTDYATLVYSRFGLQEQNSPFFSATEAAFFLIQNDHRYYNHVYPARGGFMSAINIYNKVAEIAPELSKEKLVQEACGFSRVPPLQSVKPLSALIMLDIADNY